MVLSDTMDMKEGPALCSKTQAEGNAGGGPGQGPRGQEGHMQSRGGRTDRLSKAGARGTWRGRRGGQECGQSPKCELLSAD